MWKTYRFDRSLAAFRTADQKNLCSVRPRQDFAWTSSRLKWYGIAGRGRPVTNWGARLIVVGTIVGVVCTGFVPSVTAQPVSTADQSCINAFNKGVRKVAKAQGGIIKKCLADFASGKLTSMTPEACIVSDSGNDLNRAVQSAYSKAASKCQAGIPAFGASAPIEGALAAAVLRQLDLGHSALGFNLNTSLIATPVDAKCQSQVGATLVKCADRRLREFLKCKKTGMANGAITDGPSLEAECLGTGASGQTDPTGRIALQCGTKVLNAITQHCGSTDLAVAFSPCDQGNPAAAANCLKQHSACQFCLLANEADALNRDCDLFDDGNAGNGSCGSECGDGVLQLDELCDDGNNLDLDGCSAFCSIEGGWSCAGEPSVCTLKCGNGALDPGENCDDGDLQGGDGCSSACLVESGFTCTGEPSVCVHTCGNGILNAGEACDDDDEDSGDGCSSTCQIEGGYQCAGQPSVCTFVCGNGSFQSGETCDDGDAASGDGCNGVCQIEQGWLCFGQPSVCIPVCGDGLKRGSEICDDGDTASLDGCSSICQQEPGWQCSGEPSNCLAVCGDGFIRGFENCDDLNTTSGDGCSGNFCLQEVAYSCLGQPSICFPDCGDGNLDPQEQCDDGDTTNGDGCNSACQTEAGYACFGQPSVCDPTCGNAAINSGETCDDGNTVSRDGCSKSCKTESGWLCTTPGSPCVPFNVFIDSPAHGTFTTAGSVVITGHYTTLPMGQVSVTVNGVAASSLDQINRTFSHTISLSQTAIFNPVRVILTNTANGDDVHDRIVVIAGPSVADGAFSPQSVALRINDSGFNAVEPLVGQLTAGQFDLSTLAPVGTVLIDDCFIDSFLGCLGGAEVRIANPPPSISGVSLSIDSQIGSVFADIRVNDIRIDIDIDGSGLVPNCGLRLTANQMILTGNYTLEPKVGDESNIDVNLITNPLNVSFAGFNQSFTSGICDAPIIGDIIQAFVPDLESLAVDAIRGELSDPDGGGPGDSPIADGIETALEGISIAGPLGEGLGLQFESPLFAVTEDNTGVTFGSNSRFQMQFGSGPGQCIPPPGAPNLTASYAKAAVFPSFGANTPVNNTPYGLGLCISAAGFNQMLRGQTECGLMQASLSSIDLDGSGGQPAFAITPGLLQLIVPEFSQLPANLPLRIDIGPSIAPVVTGDAGPSGSLTEIRLAQLLVSIVEPGPETVWLQGAVDASLGLNLTFLPDGSALEFGLVAPASGNLSIAIIENPLGANEAQVETVLPSLLSPLLPELSGALSGFPLPEFFGLVLQGVEVSRSGQFLSLYANLTAAP